MNYTTHAQRMAAASNNPEALAAVLASMVTTLGPAYVDALKSALGASGEAPKTSAFRRSTGELPLRAVSGLTGREREEMDRAMGAHRHSFEGRPIQGPTKLADGRFLLPTMKPSDVRRLAAGR